MSTIDEIQTAFELVFMPGPDNFSAFLGMVECAVMESERGTYGRGKGERQFCPDGIGIKAAHQRNIHQAAAAFDALKSQFGA